MLLRVYGCMSYSFLFDIFNLAEPIPSLVELFLDMTHVTAMYGYTLIDTLYQTPISLIWQAMEVYLCQGQIPEVYWAISSRSSTGNYSRRAIVYI